MTGMILAGQASIKGTMELATQLVDSGFMPRGIDTPQKAFAIITMGQELGLKPWMALNNINVIQGKPTINAQLMLALIRKSGELEDIKIDDPKTIADSEACSVTMKRKGQSPHTEIFTKNMAMAMGLWGKDNWQKQPGTMLKWRAISACARIVFPDVIQGFYTPEEINPTIIVDGETGEIIDAVPVGAGTNGSAKGLVNDDTDKVIGKPDAPPPVSNGVHWSVKPAGQKWLKTAIFAGLGLTEAEALKFAGVKKFADFKGQPEDLLKKVQSKAGVQS